MAGLPAVLPVMRRFPPPSPPPPALPRAARRLVVALAMAGVAAAAAAAADPITIEPAILDPARRARLEAWWRNLRAAEPVIETVTRHLRNELSAWRSRPTHPGCQRARRALLAVDRESLVRDAEYQLTIAVSRALAELEAAAVACLERRYFELDYRLQVAEAQLDRARELARGQLARPRPP